MYDLSVEGDHEFFANGVLVHNSWRDSQHDDLVLAVALAAWLGERSIEIGPDSFAADYAALERQYPRGVFD